MGEHNKKATSLLWQSLRTLINEQTGAGRNEALDLMVEQLEAGADPNAINEQGQTPLMFMAEHIVKASAWSKEILSSLIAAGAQPLQHDRALLRFAKHALGQIGDSMTLQVVQRIERYGKPENDRDEQGNNAFHQLALYWPGSLFDGISVILSGYEGQDDKRGAGWLTQINQEGDSPFHLLFNEQGPVGRLVHDPDRETLKDASSLSWLCLDIATRMEIDFDVHDGQGRSVTDLVIARIREGMVCERGLMTTAIMKTMIAENDRRLLDEGTSVPQKTNNKGLRL